MLSLKTAQLRFLRKPLKISQLADLVTTKPGQIFGKRDSVNIQKELTQPMRLKIDRICHRSHSAVGRTQEAFLNSPRRRSSPAPNTSRRSADRRHRTSARK